jgi:hypothetical protein
VDRLFTVDFLPVRVLAAAAALPVFFFRAVGAFFFDDTARRAGGVGFPGLPVFRADARGLTGVSARWVRAALRALDSLRMISGSSSSRHMYHDATEA